jgi:microcin C transport system substrate-binding protein
MMKTPFIARRDFLMLGGAALASPLLPAGAYAALPTGERLYGISAFGDLKYGPDFTHFEYANLDAPKAGTFNFSPPNWAFNQSVLTFNTLNTFVARGDAPPRMEMCFDSLMAGSLDEPDAQYGLLAESVEISDDRNTYVFRMRPEARFHDGSKLTAEDAAFTFNLFKDEAHPALMLPLMQMEEAVADDEHTLRLVFSGLQAPRTLATVASYPIVSQAFFDDNPFDASQLNPPLGSGPYKVGRFSSGTFIEYDRADNYWARDLPVNRGLYHFDRIRIEFFRDRNAAFEAFKKGDILYRQEFTASVWATGYDFPAHTDGRVVRREFPSELRPSMQVWALNQRRSRFADRRVRRAIGMCFDFEWTNRNIFHDAYSRSHSTFERSDYKAEGAPSEAELELLEPFRDDLPEEVFGEPFLMPVRKGSGDQRRIMGEARQMIMDAGWTIRNGVFFNEDGERLTMEYLVQDEVFVRSASPFIENLRRIGIDASIRIVDSSQYQSRIQSFDFDMVGRAYSLGATPSRDAMTNMFHSRSANVQGSSNLAGIESPAVDALIDLAGDADDRETFTTILRALDRVLRARQDLLPNWHAPSHRAAFWDMFGYDEPKPDYGFPVEMLWWYDRDKAAAIGRA